jgi:hypothetical protein
MRVADALPALETITLETSGSLPRSLWEKLMYLPEDIRLKIEANTYKETILDVVERLQKEGVVITHDVLAAIQATIDLTRDVEE